MRLCVSIPCFFNEHDMPSAFERMAELGYTAAETYNWKILDPKEIKALVKNTGVELLSACTTEFRMTTPEHRKLWLDGLKESAEAVSKMGIKKLITQVGQDSGAERQLQHDSIVQALREAKPILEATGVTIMIEPLNILFDHNGYYLWSAVEAFDIIREADNPYAKVVYDIYHQQAGEGNIIPNVINNLDVIAHLHSAGHPGRIELQFGENNYNFIFDAIDKAGYTGACGLEYRPTLDKLESLKIAMELYGKK